MCLLGSDEYSLAISSNYPLDGQEEGTTKVHVKGQALERHNFRCQKSLSSGKSAHEATVAQEMEKKVVSSWVKSVCVSTS